MNVTLYHWSVKISICLIFSHLLIFQPIWNNASMPLPPPPSLPPPLPSPPPLPLFSLKHFLVLYLCVLIENSPPKKVYQNYVKDLFFLIFQLLMLPQNSLFFGRVDKNQGSTDKYSLIFCIQVHKYPKILFLKKNRITEGVPGPQISLWSYADTQKYIKIARMANFDTL